MFECVYAFFELGEAGEHLDQPGLDGPRQILARVATQHTGEPLGIFGADAAATALDLVPLGT